MKSSRLMTWLMTLGVLVDSLLLSDCSTEAPLLDAAQYKDFLFNLKCAEFQIFHSGKKFPEIGGPLYTPSPALQSPPPPLEPVSPNPASPTILPSAAELSTLKPTSPVVSNSSGSGSDSYSEYDEDITSRSKREDSETTTMAPSAVDISSIFGNADTPITNGTEECTAPLTQEWSNYNWYQVLLDNGGPPAGYLGKGLKSNLTKVFDPCHRPLYHMQPVEKRTTFGFTHTTFEKVHRTEQVEIMLAGTPLEFVDVIGELVWAPPNSTRRYFHLTYRKDDTGLYFELDYQKKCVFYEYNARVDCKWLPSICDCVNGIEHCDPIPPPPAPAAGIPAGLNAALVGGG